MIKLVKSATPAAKAVLRQATALFPRRKKASDGLLPSKAHVKQNPNSDHNSGFGVDITHDPVNGINCALAFNELKHDKRVKYLIFRGVIWSAERGGKLYRGSNRHEKHLHISIKDNYGNATAPWFPWITRKPTIIGKVRAIITPLPKKKVR